MHTKKYVIKKVAILNVFIFISDIRVLFFISFHEFIISLYIEKNQEHFLLTVGHLESISDVIGNGMKRIPGPGNSKKSIKSWKKW